MQGSFPGSIWGVDIHAPVNDCRYGVNFSVLSRPMQSGA
jgi:hypothetical protein